MEWIAYLRHRQPFHKNAISGYRGRWNFQWGCLALMKFWLKYSFKMFQCTPLMLQVTNVVSALMPCWSRIPFYTWLHFCGMKLQLNDMCSLPLFRCWVGAPMPLLYDWKIMIAPIAQQQKSDSFSSREISSATELLWSGSALSNLTLWYFSVNYEDVIIFFLKLSFSWQFILLKNNFHSKSNGIC